MYLKDYYLYFGYGAKQTFFSGLTNLFGFNGLAYLFFLKPLLKKEKYFKKISIIAIIISSIYLFLSVACLLLVFSFITQSSEGISIYLLTRMISFGDFLQRSDAIFIMIWILSVFSYISIALFFIIYITKKLTNLLNTNSINYCYSSIILGLSLLPQNFAQYIAFIEIMFKYYSLSLVFIIDILILIFANIKFKIVTNTKKTT